MSQVAAERPTRGSSKPSLGGQIRSGLIYALLSAIPPAKRAVTVAPPPGAAGAAQSARSADLKQDGRAAQDGRGRHASAVGRQSISDSWLGHFVWLIWFEGSAVPVLPVGQASPSRGTRADTDGSCHHSSRCRTGPFAPGGDLGSLFFKPTRFMEARI